MILSFVFDSELAGARCVPGAGGPDPLLDFFGDDFFLGFEVIDTL